MKVMNARRQSQRIAHLIRMRDMKAERLSNFKGTEEHKSWLRMDISALNFAISVLQQAQILGVLDDLT